MFGNEQIGRHPVAILDTAMPPAAKIGLPPGNVLFSRFAPLGGAVETGLTCAKCNLRETCLSGGVPAEDLEYVENIVYARRHIKRGELLFGAGDEFKCLFAVRSGFFKMSFADGDGREQVTGFFMSGELLGMDGLGSGRCEGNAIALEDSLVCAMPYALIEDIGRDVPSLQRRLHSVLAREIVRGQGIMVLLASMGARQRVAAFLISLSRRFASRGFSGSRFVLRMTRAEIASYLGLEIETVSRAFSAFHSDGLIDVRRRQVNIIDIERLERLLAHGGGQEAIRTFSPPPSPGVARGPGAPAGTG